MLLVFPEITPGPQLSLHRWQTADRYQAGEEVPSLSLKAGFNTVSVQSNKSRRQAHRSNIFMLNVNVFLLIWSEDKSPPRLIELNMNWAQLHCNYLWPILVHFVQTWDLGSLKLLSRKSTSQTCHLRQLQNLSTADTTIDFHFHWTSRKSAQENADADVCFQSDAVTQILGVCPSRDALILQWGAFKSLQKKRTNKMCKRAPQMVEKLYIYFVSCINLRNITVFSSLHSGLFILKLKMLIMLCTLFNRVLLSLLWLVSNH